MATALAIGLAAWLIWVAGERRWRRAERARLRADLERGVLLGLYPWLPSNRRHADPERYSEANR